MIEVGSALGLETLILVPGRLTIKCFLIFCAWKLIPSIYIEKTAANAVIDRGLHCDRLALSRDSEFLFLAWNYGQVLCSGINSLL